MGIGEKIALRQAVAVGLVCAVFCTSGFVAAAQYQGFVRWLLLFAACVWASIGLVTWLVLLSPFGWFGRLGQWVDRFMSDDWPQED